MTPYRRLIATPSCVAVIYEIKPLGPGRALVFRKILIPSYFLFAPAISTARDDDGSHHIRYRGRLSSFFFSPRPRRATTVRTTMTTMIDDDDPEKGSDPRKVFS